MLFHQHAPGQAVRRVARLNGHPSLGQNRSVVKPLRHHMHGASFHSWLNNAPSNAETKHSDYKGAAIPHDRTLYRQRHHIENMFARIKDWHRIHTRYDQCARTFLSAIAFAATFIFWRNQ